MAAEKAAACSRSSGESLGSGSAFFKGPKPEEHGAASMAKEFGSRDKPGRQAGGMCLLRMAAQAATAAVGAARSAP